MQKINARRQFVQKLGYSENKQPEETDMTDHITFPANGIGKHLHEYNNNNNGNNNNNNYDTVYGAIIRTSHCESSLGSSDECRLSAG